VPPFVNALGWIDLLNLSDGLFFGFLGKLIVDITIYLPIALFFNLLTLQKIDPNQIRSAMLNSDKIGIFFYILLPKLKLSILFSSMIIFILSFNEITVSNTLRYNSFMLQSFKEFSAFYSIQNSILLSIPLFLILFIILKLETKAKKNKIFYLSTKKRDTIFKNFMDNKISYIALFLYLSSAILPIIFLLKGVSFEILKESFLLAKEPIFYTFTFAITTSILLLGVGFFITLIQYYGYSSRIVKLLWLGFITPSTILASSLILFYNHKWSAFIYNSPLLLLFAFLAKYLIIGQKLSMAKIVQIPKNQLLMASILGADRFSQIIYIIYPKLKKSLFAIFLISFILIFRDGTLSMILENPNHEMINPFIITYMANTDKALVDSLLFLIIISLLVPFFILGAIYDRD
jgi:iron(III) transport system permease protein